MKKYMVTLTKDEREVLGNLVSKGKHRSQKILNALILLDCDAGVSGNLTPSSQARCSMS